SGAAGDEQDDVALAQCCDRRRSAPGLDVEQRLVERAVVGGDDAAVTHRAARRERLWCNGAHIAAAVEQRLALAIGRDRRDGAVRSTVGVVLLVGVGQVVVGAVAERLVAALLAAAEQHLLAVLLGDISYRADARADMRAVAERLRLAAPAGAPDIG